MKYVIFYVNFLVAVDGKKKEIGGVRMHPSKNHPSKEVDLSSDEEDAEEDEEEEYQPESSGDHSEISESPSSASEEDEACPTASSSIRGIKRKKEVKKSESRVRAKRPAKKQTEQGEVQHAPILAKAAEEGGKKGKKETPVFNDKNVDIDLFHSSPSNVVARKIKVSNNLMVTCRNIDQIDGAKQVGYDFAALTFQRKTANDKMFEFIVPLALSTRIVEAIQHIVQENKKFFKQQL